MISSHTDLPIFSNNNIDSIYDEIIGSVYSVEDIAGLDTIKELYEESLGAPTPDFWELNDNNQPRYCLNYERCQQRLVQLEKEEKSNASRASRFHAQRIEIIKLAQKYLADQQQNERNLQGDLLEQFMGEWIHFALNELPNLEDNEETVKLINRRLDYLDQIQNSTWLAKSSRPAFSEKKLGDSSYFTTEFKSSLDAVFLEILYTSNEEERKRFIKIKDSFMVSHHLVSTVNLFAELISIRPSAFFQDYWYRLSPLHLPKNESKNKIEQQKNWRLGGSYDDWMEGFYTRNSKIFIDGQDTVKLKKSVFNTEVSKETVEALTKDFIEKSIKPIQSIIENERPKWRFKWGLWPIKTKGWPFNHQANEFAEALLNTLTNIHNHALETQQLVFFYLESSNTLDTLLIKQKKAMIMEQERFNKAMEAWQQEKPTIAKSKERIGLFASRTRGQLKTNSELPAVEKEPLQPSENLHIKSPRRK